MCVNRVSVTAVREVTLTSLALLSLLFTVGCQAEDIGRAGDKNFTDVLQAADSGVRLALPIRNEGNAAILHGLIVDAEGRKGSSLPAERFAMLRQGVLKSLEEASAEPVRRQPLFVYDAAFAFYSKQRTLVLAVCKQCGYGVLLEKGQTGTTAAVPIDNLALARTIELASPGFASRPSRFEVLD